MRRSIRVLAALALWLAAVGPTVYGLIAVLSGPVSLEEVILPAAFLLLLLAFPSVGLVIAIRCPGNVIGWILLLMGLTFAASSFAYDYAITSLESGSRSPAVLLAAWFNEQTFSLIAVGMTIVFLTFPAGRLPAGRVRLPGLLSASASLAGWALAAVRPGPLGSFEGVDNPLGAPGIVGEVVSAMGDVPGLATIGALVLSLGLLVVRFRTARGDERQQLKWLALAGGAVMLPVIGLVVPQVAGAAVGTLLYSISEVSYFGLLLTLPLVPLAIGLAILRYRLYDIDRIISRTTSYGLITALLVAVFLIVNLGLQSLLSAVTSGNSLAVAGSTLLAAALFTPVRRRVQRVVDRRFNRARYDAERTAGAFSVRMRAATDLPTVTFDLDVTLRRAMAPSHLGLWLRGSDR